MSEMAQGEADALLKMAKYRCDDLRHQFPISGGSLRVLLRSKESHEHFGLDISRSRIEMRKNTFQKRARKNTVLVRLDLGGSPHRNPDGVEILCPHIHLYREGYGDKWAYELPKEFSDLTNIRKTLEEFFEYCNIVEEPYIEGLH